MIITQKYNSAEDIDPEFIPSLESLLENCVPSFELIKNYEKAAQDNINFAYYLFFGNTTNAPIGFAQVEMQKNTPVKKSFFSRFKKESPLDSKINTHLKWSIPGSYKEGIVFDPKFIKHASDKTKKIFNEYFEREDIQTQELIFSGAYESLNIPFQSQTYQNKDIVSLDTFIKNKQSYESFLSDLPRDLNQLIKRSWKNIQQDLNLKLGEYTSFKDAFSYKTNAANQYKELKQKPQIKKYLSVEEGIEFLTLESSESIEALVVFIKGSGHHCFYEILHLSDKAPEIIPHQMAILKFFEKDSVNKLHALGEITQTGHLLDIGFTKRNQRHISISKEK